MNIILLDLLWFRMLYSSARIEICPQELYWSKVLASMHNYPRHPARPLVSVVAVKGFGGRKTFLRAAAVLIHLPADMCSPPNVEGAGQLHVYKRYTRLLSKNIHFNCFEYQLFCLLTIVQRCFYIRAQQNSQILFEIRIHQAVPRRMLRHTQALHTYRINLSPFTKDFRVWGAPIET